jgi:hypothetical protein
MLIILENNNNDIVKSEDPRPQGGTSRKGNVIFDCAPRPIGPLDPAYKAGLAGHLPVKIRWQSKKLQIQGAQILRNEAYLPYAAVTKDAAQHRSWTFYEAINNRRRIVINARGMIVGLSSRVS